jgi:copper(I)-binding protein
VSQAWTAPIRLVCSFQFYQWETPEMRLKIVILSLLALVPAAAAQANEAASKGVTIEQPWARETPAGATVGAAFLTIRTDKDTSDRLTGISSPVAGRAEVHSSSMVDGIMKMRRLDGIDLKSGETHVLKPMGEHIMLFDLKHPLKQGDVVDLTLTFEKAGAITTQAKVESMAAMSPENMGHQHDGTMDSMSHDKMMSPHEMNGEMHHGDHSQ